MHSKSYAHFSVDNPVLVYGAPFLVAWFFGWPGFLVQAGLYFLALLWVHWEVGFAFDYYAIGATIRVAMGQGAGLVVLLARWLFA